MIEQASERYQNTRDSRFNRVALISSGKVDSELRELSSNELK